MRKSHLGETTSGDRNAIADVIALWQYRAINASLFFTPSKNEFRRALYTKMRNATNTCPICLNELNADIIALPCCTNVVHANCICKLQATPLHGICSICHHDLRVRTQYYCGVLNGHVCDIAPFVIFGRKNTLAELRGEIDNHLPLHDNYTISHYSRAISCDEDLAKVVPWIENGYFNIRLTIYHDGIQRRIREIAAIMSMPSEQYIQSHPLRIYGRRVRLFVRSHEMRAFAVEQTDTRIVLRLDPPVCFEQYPATPRRYYLFEGGNIFSMSDEFEVAQIQPDVRGNISFKYNALTYTWEDDIIRIMKRATY